MRGFSIGRLAKLANVSIDTIRFYEKAGLLAPHIRRPSGFREYSIADLKQLRFIRCGRQLGFSLEEMGELLALKSGQASATSVVHEQLRAIDRKIEELTRWRRGLLDFLDAPATAEPDGHSILDCFYDDSTDAAVAFIARSPQESQRDCNDQL
jgi:MerR family copper efflux transcriptional regulator